MDVLAADCVGRAMNKLKIGDKVWIGPGTVAWCPDEHCDPSINLQRYGATACQHELIPDVPNLAAAARVLAAHPDGFMALGRVVGNIESDQKGETDFVWDYNDAELGFIRALAAALNGGTA